MVYGGGAAALRAAIELTETGCRVLLVGPVDAARWPSLATGGIECADDVEAAFLDAIIGGDFLAERAPVRAMMRAAPGVIEELVRLGVPFARDGRELRHRRLDGMRSARAAFVESRTTRAVVDALDDQATRLGVERLSHHALEALVANDQERFAGAVVQDRVSMRFVSIEAHAMILALGGAELTLAASPTAVATEAALAIAFDAGATLANMEFIQTAPAAVWLGPRVENSPRGRRAIVPSSSLIGEGAVYWLPREPDDVRLGRDLPQSDRRAFLEDAFPGWGSAAPHDLATHVVRHEVLTRGLYDRRRDKHQPLAYLDVSHLPEAHLRERAGSELDLYRKLSGADPYRGPLPIHPALSDRLGGLWVDFDVDENGNVREDSPRNHATTIEGVYACGGAAHLYHGANRLSGNLLLADLFGARCAANAVRAYREGLSNGGAPPCFARAITTAEATQEDIQRRRGGEAPLALHARLRELIYAKAGFSRDRSGLAELVQDLDDLAEAVGKARPRDENETANRGIALVRDLEHAVLLAAVTARCALARRECRGVHHRGDHDARRSIDDEPPRRPTPRLTLARRDDLGLNLADSVRVRLFSETRDLAATIDEDGVTEELYPRHYAVET